MLGFGGVYNTMKKLIVLLLIVFSMCSLFAVQNSTDPYRMQTISGFIDDILYLNVSPFLYDGIVQNGYAGINLDHNDSANDFRYLIQPTPSTPLQYPGLVIGTFSVLVTYKNINLSTLKLIVTHNKLVHSNDNSVKLDYELAVMYTLNDGSGNQNSAYVDIAAFCYSEDASTNDKIEINLKQGSGVSSIQNANIYFRLKDGDTPTVTGQYYSTIKFSLETT